MHARNVPTRRILLLLGHRMLLVAPLRVIVWALDR